MAKKGVGVAHAPEALALLPQLVLLKLFPVCCSDKALLVIIHVILFLSFLELWSEGLAGR